MALLLREPVMKMAADVYLTVEISELNNRWNKMALEESAKQKHPLGQAPERQVQDDQHHQSKSHSGSPTAAGQGR
jgi:hypothetical protein